MVIDHTKHWIERYSCHRDDHTKLFGDLGVVWYSYGTAQRQLDSREQTTGTVWHFYPHPRVRVQAHTHATTYPLRVISTTDKNTSLSSSFLYASHYTHTHCQVRGHVPVKYFTSFPLWPYPSYLLVNQLVFDRSIKEFYLSLLFNSSSYWCL